MLSISAREAIILEGAQDLMRMFDWGFGESLNGLGSYIDPLRSIIILFGEVFFEPCTKNEGFATSKHVKGLD